MNALEDIGRRIRRISGYLDEDILKTIIIKISSRAPFTLFNLTWTIPVHIKNEVLLYLAQDKKLVGHVAEQIIFHYENLSPELRSLLFKLADDKECGYNIASVISLNYTQLPSNVRNLIFKLADNKETAKDVYELLLNNSYVNLPNEVKEDLLMRIRKNKFI